MSSTNSPLHEAIHGIEVPPIEIQFEKAEFVSFYLVNGSTFKMHSVTIPRHLLAETGICRTLVLCEADDRDSPENLKIPTSVLEGVKKLVVLSKTENYHGLYRRTVTGLTVVHSKHHTPNWYRVTTQLLEKKTWFAETI